MTVAELKYLLEDLDDDQEIGYEDNEFGYTEIDEIIDTGRFYIIQ